REVDAQRQASPDANEGIASGDADRRTGEREADKPDEVATPAEATAVPTLKDVVSDLYSKGKEYAQRQYGMTFFKLADTPDFMKELGLTGERFTIRYGVISRHVGKDGSHDITAEEWERLPEALQDPFAITRFDGKEKGFRLYTTLKNQKGEYIVVGVDVKNAGRDLEVNAVSTVFGRREDARLTAQEEVIYRSPKITPEQQSLLNGPNSHQYPAARELSESKGSEKSAELQEGQEIIVRDSNGSEVKASVVGVKGDKAGVWTAGKLNDRSVKADGAPGYLTEIEKTDIIPDKEELDRSTGEQKGDKPVEATEANKPTDEADGGSSFVGRSLTEAEATEVIGRMEANAETAPELELTIQNWDKLFGETGQVVTPIGEVTMGEHQFAKMMRQGRNGKLGLIKPTLEKPDVIIEQESEAKEGEITSRPSSFIFVKSFIKEDGSRYYHFTSITVSREGKEVVISNQEKSRNKILRLLQGGKIVWYTPKDVTTYSADRQGLDYEQPKNADDASKGSGITPQTMISESKGSETPAEMQVLTTEIAEGSALSRIPVGEDGEPMFEAVD
ncbi:MAG: hypothetical protein K2M80_01720, partial [Muribaculaceae bacterium]|nr:hypothetical protein [Muribaculaceae bacterium]